MIGIAFKKRDGKEKSEKGESRERKKPSRKTKKRAIQEDDGLTKAKAALGR
jgi:hypothetical protein